MDVDPRKISLFLVSMIAILAVVNLFTTAVRLLSAEWFRAIASIAVLAALWWIASTEKPELVLDLLDQVINTIASIVEVVRASIKLIFY